MIFLRAARTNLGFQEYRAVFKTISAISPEFAADRRWIFINKAGIKIQNIKAGTLYGYNLGVRDRYDYIPGVLSNSLFSIFLTKNGLNIHKGESTRDVICLDFDFGSRSFEEEMAHLISMKEAATDEASQNHIQELINKVEENKYKYVKRTKDEIRELFYQKGVSVEYITRDKKGNTQKKTVIHYKMLYRNSSKAKLGQVMFINKKLYRAAYDWLTMGLGKKLPHGKAKIVEISAYAPLTTSTIEQTLHIPVENILILKDQDSFFETLGNVVRAEDYDGTERVVDTVKTERAKQRAIDAGKIDILGNPIYKTVYKSVVAKKRKCVVGHEKVRLKNTLWDGMALIETESLPGNINGMALLRNHFFKACAFRTRIGLFLSEWCERCGYDYETYEIEDMFGIKHRAKDIQIITTNNAIKWLKFADLMGNTPQEAYEYWCDKIRADGNLWGVVKTDHQSKLGGVQQMSYQMINSLPCSTEEVHEIAQQSIDYVELLKVDDCEFDKFLQKNANAVNHFEMLSALYHHNPDFANSTWFRTEKRKIINQYVVKLRGGKITVNADNLTLCGNPYALLLHAVGEDWQKDPTFSHEDGTIQCYTKRFEFGEYLAAFRSPQNSPNNICYLHNVYSDEMDKYFVFSSNIVAVNCIETDIQDRGNGLDFDSDFFFTTNNPIIVQCAKYCYQNYPTIVNQLKESGLTYNNTPLEYAKMDNKFSLSRRGIGESSNLAQLALTYYWTKPSQELYDNFVVLSVLAQCIIDGCKREYEVDAISEIERIKSMECMNIYIGNKRKDLPYFMKYTKDVPVTKNGKELPYENIKESKAKIKCRLNRNLVCPMNYLQDWLDKIQGASQAATTPTSEFFIKMSGKANDRQMSKVRALVAQYDAFIRTNREQLFDPLFIPEFQRVSDLFYDNIIRVKIGNIVTINRLIETALCLATDNNNSNVNPKEGTKYVRRLLDAVYKMNPSKFLLNFVQK